MPGLDMGCVTGLDDEDVELIECVFEMIYWRFLGCARGELDSVDENGGYAEEQQGE